jgi:hypothetical protein
MPAGTVLKLDGGAGFERSRRDFGDRTEAVIFAGQVNVNEFANGGYIRNFEQIPSSRRAPATMCSRSRGGSRNKFATREGNDIINPGLASTSSGPARAANDLLILDYSARRRCESRRPHFQQWPGHAARYGHERDRGQHQHGNGSGFERYQITGGTKADSLTTGTGADILIGNGWQRHAQRRQRQTT